MKDQTEWALANIPVLIGVIATILMILGGVDLKVKGMVYMSLLQSIPVIRIMGSIYRMPVVGSLIG